jgi:hypothetical protein
MTPHQLTHWQNLAEQASKEMDSDKLAVLITELNRVLCEGEETTRKQRRQRIKEKIFRAAA